MRLAVDDRPRVFALPHRAIRYGRQPPGQLTMLLAVLVLLCLGAGLAGALDIQHRRAVLTGVIARGGPLTRAAVDIYQSLSDADATAAGAFLVGGLEPPDLRERYQANIGVAAAALTAAAAGSPTGESAAAVAQLAAYLPVYTGLIETARSYNRLGLPQGVAFLREASSLVQEKLLPQAQRLYRDENARLAADQAEAGGLDWFPLALGVLALAGLLAAQFYLTRTTRRILNAGLLAATLAALAAVLWLGIASTSAAGHSSAGRRDGTAQVEAFAEARIAALQARGYESLTLAARGNGKVYEDGFIGTEKRLDGDHGLFAKARNAVTNDETGKAIRIATDAWRQWSASHQKLRALDNGGSYNEAVLLATSRDPGGPAELSTVVDKQLDSAIQQASGRFEDGTGTARRALSMADLGVAGLLVLAALGAGFGFAPRLREFR